MIGLGRGDGDGGGDTAEVAVRGREAAGDGDGDGGGEHFRGFGVGGWRMSPTSENDYPFAGPKWVVRRIAYGLKTIYMNLYDINLYTTIHISIIFFQKNERMWTIK